MTYDKEKTCSFTGHRIIPWGEREFIEKETEEICLSLIKRGYTNFIAGGALGFDTIAQRCILRLREINPQIKLIIAIPCKEQYKNWRKSDIEVYNQMLDMADEKIYVSDEYTPECMKKRNRFMVDRSSVCIAYVKKVTGGTAYTVKYAVEEGREIIFVRP